MMYQPVYLVDGTITSISCVVFASKASAHEYASMVCKRNQTFEIVELEVIGNDQKTAEG